MKKKSVVDEGEQIKLAIEMINLGARLQLLESQTTLSRERLIKLYKELRHCSPPKGMLPFSTDWFLTWQPNIHSSIFYNIYKFMIDYTGVEGIHAILKAYRLYMQQVQENTPAGEDRVEPVLSLTRAWTLIRFVESDMLKLETCECCGGRFIVNTYDLNKSYACNLCHVPSRAGKTKKAKAKSLNYKLVSMEA